VHWVWYLAEIEGELAELRFREAEQRAAGSPLRLDGDGG